MSHGHKHKCQCEHENLKYCKSCRHPYCMDCGEEWGTNSWYKWYYQPYYTQTVGGVQPATTAIGTTQNWQTLLSKTEEDKDEGHKCR